jgi:hypothetical protein
MRLSRRGFLAGAAAFLPGSAWAFTPSPEVAARLAELSDTGLSCQASAAARETSRRLAGVPPVGRGKTIIVNVPALRLVAYEDGVPVMSRLVAVGAPEHRTPVADTSVTYVEAHPTWTAPESIVRRKSFRRRLTTNPAWFRSNGFVLIAEGGRRLSLQEASADPSSVATFVQEPGPMNVLGRVKMGLAGMPSILLHDTNDLSSFGEDGGAVSGGCVRIEDPVPLAEWVAGTRMPEAWRRQRFQVPAPVRVLIGYWTAWPDEVGGVQTFPDPYRKDTARTACGPEARSRTPVSYEADDDELDLLEAQSRQAPPRQVPLPGPPVSGIAPAFPGAPPGFRWRPVEVR